MTATGYPPPRREAVTAGTITHAAVGAAIATALAAYAASGGDFPADRVMAVVLVGLAVSGLAVWWGEPETGL
ncbi:MAG TPA: hypothetical protein VF170_00395 [Planctomycetaceae bacterium]